MGNNLFSRADIERKITIPQFSEELAEFMGIIFGDGYLIERGRIHRMGITLNHTEDQKYSRYVVSIIRNLFGIYPRLSIREKTNRLDLLIHSKGIANFISKYLPSGIKKNKLVIPKWILKNKIYSAAFLRGLVDTDGSLFFAKRGTYNENRYPVIEIKLHDKQLVKQLGKLLLSFGFKANVFDNKVQLNGKKQLEKWLSEVGFKNMNHLSRYWVWLERGYCPPKTTFKERMNIIGGIGRPAIDLSVKQSPAVHSANLSDVQRAM